jgi:hypothetical protein
MLKSMPTRKDPAAVKLGRRGGQRRVAKGFSMMPKEQLSELGKKAAEARWGKKRGKRGAK